MNKEELLEAVSKIPIGKTKSCVSAYNSVSVEKLANAVDKCKKMPTYNDILIRYNKSEQENTNLKQALNEIREYVNSHSLYKEEYDYDYEENSYLSGISDEIAKQDILQIIDKVGGNEE